MGEFRCTGFPISDTSTHHSVEIARNLRLYLRFEDDEAVDDVWRHSNGERGRRYVHVWFERVTSPTRGLAQDAQKMYRRQSPDRRRRGRPPALFWDLAKAEAMSWLDYNGYPEPGDGNQAVLERHIAQWLAVRGHTPTESTIREYVAGWIAEFRAGRMEADKSN